ncbi:MAG TPA: DNA-processing protein DprA, partial [Reyranella sp.]|nr:DNA-processing protein DprA [Reyranella sp.]
VTVRDLIAFYGTAAKALEALPELARRGGGARPVRLCSKADAEREIETLRKLGARLIARADPDYPEALAALEDAPPVIAVKGRAELLQPARIALVGARNASANGRRIASDLAAGLAQAGAVVVSGMARGIDTAAHLGALNAGSKTGGTIAVVAGGVDVLYPPENGALFERLGAEGLIVAESAPGTEPVARHFPRRNRIISGLSRAVVVVEAALKSGSLITARYALDQGREVMAVPGSPLDPRCRGANRLIREGARLVEDFAQVLESLDGLAGSYLKFHENLRFNDQTIEINTLSETDRVRDEVLSLLGPSPVMVDELVRQCHCSPPVLGMVLLELDLAGRLERHPGNRVSLLMQAA